MTTDPDEAERLLATRRLALPSIERLGRALIEDIAVPRSQLAAAVRGVAEIATAKGVRIFTFAHAGDGNLHPIIAVRSEDPEHLAAVDQRGRSPCSGSHCGSAARSAASTGSGCSSAGWLHAEPGPRVA